MDFLKFLHDIKKKIEIFESLPEDSEEKFNIWCEFDEIFNGYLEWEVMMALACLKIANEGSYSFSNDFYKDINNYLKFFDKMIYEKFVKTKNKEIKNE